MKCCVHSFSDRGSVRSGKFLGIVLGYNVNVMINVCGGYHDYSLAFWLIGSVEHLGEIFE